MSRMARQPNKTRVQLMANRSVKMRSGRQNDVTAGPRTPSSWFHRKCLRISRPNLDSEAENCAVIGLICLPQTRKSFQSWQPKLSRFNTVNLRKTGMRQSRHSHRTRKESPAEMNAGSQRLVRFGAGAK